MKSLSPEMQIEHDRIMRYMAARIPQISAHCGRVLGQQRRFALERAAFAAVVQRKLGEARRG